MINETTTNVEPSPEANATEQNTDSTVNNFELTPAQELAQLRATNERLLQESRKYKSTAQELKRDKEAREKKELEQQGKWKDMYEALNQKHSNMTASLIKERCLRAVGNIASKEGCVNTEALLKLGNSELLQYDEDTHQVVGADLFVEASKRDYPFLFSQKQSTGISPATPGGGGIQTKQPLSAGEIVKLNPNDKRAVMMELFRK